MYIDISYVIYVLPAVLLAMWAQMSVQGTFKQYSQVMSSKRVTGCEAARRILDANGLTNVIINRISGDLSDHFDPRTNTVNLSEKVYDSCSVASIGVAAHECGHAVQYAVGYVPMKIRSAIIPVTQIGSFLAMPLVLLGLVFSVPELAYVGCLFFALATVFQLITLPVEFNASRRAVTTLDSMGILNEDELSGSKKVLRAAAMTYVAALAVSLGQLLRLLFIVGNGRRRR